MQAEASTWQNDQTSGYHSYMGFDSSTGVVVLATGADNIDGFGSYVLGGQARAGVG